MKNKKIDDLIRKIVSILCEAGQNDPQFKIGDLIQYTPVSVAAILANHKDELYEIVSSSEYKNKFDNHGEFKDVRNKTD